MSTAHEIQENRPSTSPRAPPSLRPHRVLACVLCQQRKVKCDRQFPCANCVKSRAQCVPSTLTQRKRKRRFGDRELLEHLRKHEDLLRQNNIPFEPLHKNWTPRQERSNAENLSNSDDERPAVLGTNISTPSTTVKSEGGYQPKSVWHALSHGFRDPDEDSDSSQDEVREVTVKCAWERSFGDDELLLFGSRVPTIDVSTLHPDPVQIFKLWQIYLNNVNPLLKVTHIPSLQGRIIEAVSNLKSINPTFEALMFSIYCTAVLSLGPEDCQTMFGSSQNDLLMRYRFGCQQALLNCGFLRSEDRDCLTALFLYLISVRLSTVPQSLAAILGTAVRIAQRMGIHSEAALAKHSVLEAEMRRRLWWALVLFDTRICETSNHQNVTLEPTWDCKVPLNVNDSDLRLEMKDPPVIQGATTDALFAVVRSTLGDFIRHDALHLDITNPALKQIARSHTGDSSSGDTDFSKLEEEIEDQFLKSCDPDNPLHFMTIWTTGAQLAKWRLLGHCLRSSDASLARTDTQRDIATSYALRALQCDTKIMASPSVRGFLWLHHFYFPFPAYLQVAQDLRTRPFGTQNRQVWEVLSENYEAWSASLGNTDSPLYIIFAKLILQAWEACKVSEDSAKTMAMPKIVSSIMESLAQTTTAAQHTDTEQPNTTMDMGIDDFSISMPMNFAHQSLPYDMTMQDRSVMTPDMYSSMAQQPIFGLQNTFGWNALRMRPGWGGF